MWSYWIDRKESWVRACVTLLQRLMAMRGVAALRIIECVQRGGRVRGCRRKNLPVKVKVSDERRLAESCRLWQLFASTIWTDTIENLTWTPDELAAFSVPSLFDNSFSVY